MKELIKKRWFVFLLGILIAAVVLLGIGVILYCNGYRITYPQKFETSWNAVSGFAEWAGVAVSLISVGTSFAAVWAAIQVPKKIAQQQERVEIYAKRFDFYTTLCSCVYYSKLLDGVTSAVQADYLFIMMLGHETLMDPNEKRIREEAGLIIWKTIARLQNGEFLFEFETKDSIQKICSALISIITVEETNSDLQKCCSEYLNLMGEIKDHLIPMIENDLRITTKWNS